MRISVIDKLARKQYAVEPRQYEGRLLHQLPLVRTALGDLYAEIYLNEPSDSNRVALFRHGTRVIEDLASLEAFAHPPRSMRYLQGHIDAPFVNLTPGTRTGLVQDAAYATLCEGLRPLEHKLIEVIEDQRRAEDEQASRGLLRAIQRAFREALLALPVEEYDWFDIHARALPRDRSMRRVEQDLEIRWQIAEGAGALEGPRYQAVTLLASEKPGLTRLKVCVSQRGVVCEAEALITVTHELLAQIGATTVPSQGLPGYTFERSPGKSRRSRFDAVRNVIVINNRHRDFVYASRNKSLKLRYLVRLYAKELVLRNFVGLPADQLLERMVELSLRTEEHL